VIGEVSDCVRLPSVCEGLTTTESLLAAVLKMPANDWLIVSVRM
jgi:hypothetical protein